MHIQWNPWYIENNKIIIDEEHFEDPINFNELAEDIIPDNSKVDVCNKYNFFSNNNVEINNKIWNIIKERKNVLFYIYVTDINSIKFPDDWGDGYQNVVINYSTSSDNINEKIKNFNDVNALNKILYINPIEQKINIQENIQDIQCIQVSGGNNPCDFNWVKELQEFCKQKDLNFEFISTGKYLIMNGKTYNIPEDKQRQQALMANINLQSNFNLIKTGKKKACNTCKRLPFCKKDINICKL